MIHDSQYDYYGTKLATCASDGSVNVYDQQQNGKIIGTFKVKESPLWALTWAHPRFGNVIAVSSYDGEVSVWRELKPSDWIKVAEHTQHQGSVNAIAWAPPDDGLFLASGASDGHVIVFGRKPNTDQFLIEANFVAHKSGVNAVSWNPEHHQIIATASADKTVKIWERSFLEGYQLKLTIEGHRELVRDVQWHPQGQLLASCSEDGLVLIHSVNIGDEEFTATLIQECPFSFNVWRLAWSPIVGNQLAVSGNYGTETYIKILEADENEQFYQVEDLDQS